MSRPRTGRTRAFVDPSVQGGLLRKLSFHWSVLIVVNCVVFGAWMWLSERTDATSGDALGQTLAYCLPFLLTSAALLPVFLYDTLKLSARFAGPASRLRAALADAAAGKTVQPLQFRHDDFWQEMANDFNQLIEHNTQLAEQVNRHLAEHSPAAAAVVPTGSPIVAAAGELLGTPGVQAADQAMNLLNSVSS